MYGRHPPRRRSRAGRRTRRVARALGRPRAGEPAADDDDRAIRPGIAPTSSAPGGSRPAAARGTRVASARRRGRSPSERAGHRARAAACTPRSDMHRCSASSTTPTPSGRGCVDPAGDLRVSRSCTCRSRRPLDDARELREPDEPVAGHVADVRDAAERQQVVLAQGVERDPGDDDELVVALVVREGRGARRARASAARSTASATRRGVSARCGERMSRPSASSSASPPRRLQPDRWAGHARVIGDDGVQPAGASA